MTVLVRDPLTKRDRALLKAGLPYLMTYERVRAFLPGRWVRPVLQVLDNDRLREVWRGSATRRHHAAMEIMVAVVKGKARAA